MIKIMAAMFKPYGFWGDLSQHRRATTRYEDLCM
jgi:hypothetical protein